VPAASPQRQRHAYAIKCAIHFHMHQLVRVLAAGERSMVNTF
jgi:hypothetical protein